MLPVALLTATLPHATPGWLGPIPHLNAAPDCGSVCNVQSKYRCVGMLQNATACASSCQADSKCHVWTWSGSTEHCWHRTDNLWAPTPWPQSNVQAGCDENLPTCRAPAPPPPISPNISVTIGQPFPNGAGDVSPQSPAVALDWWVKSDSK